MAMSEFNLEENLNRIADVLGDRLEEMLESESKYKKRIEELEQENHELIEKNKTLYHENSFLRKELDEKDEVKKLLADIAVLKKENENLKYWYEKLNQKFGKIEGENKLLLSYQEQNRKLLESNKSLVEEVERLRKENKYLERENAKLREIKGRHILDC